MRPRRRHPGFTLVELVLVLLLITMVTALAAPSLRGWGRGSRLRDVAEQLQAATLFARISAVERSMIVRLVIDTGGGGYQVGLWDGSELATAPGEFANPVTLPDSMRLELVEPRDRNGVIEFHPNGRATPAVLRLTTEWGETVELANDSPVLPFQLRAVEAR